MEKKIGITVLIGFIITIIIFLFNEGEKINYLAIGDSVTAGKTPFDSSSYSYSDYVYEEYKNEIDYFIKDYQVVNLESREFYEILRLNDKILGNDKTITQLIKESDLITISIGLDELNNHSNINLYIYYMNKILDIMRNINKEGQIFLLGLYSSDEKVNDINKNLYDLTIKHNVTFIDLSILTKTDYSYENTYYLTQKGHEYIKTEISSKLIEISN